MISIGVSEEDGYGYAEINSHPRFAPEFATSMEQLTTEDDYQSPSIIFILSRNFWVLVSAIVREMISIRVNEDDGYAEVISHPRFAPDLSCYRLFDEVGAT
ncbi:hypothetical protein OIU85_007039 [Salix viminalis]|uniref:Uncharacterized protein n=1 Tax=Salix viminalis TaxID=40686 RepID=A0A9Q0SN97_SALVM|nr:hypothetical protein OIU85_007039 [Salix viminalis]